jgi:hypothetical protein
MAIEYDESTVKSAFTAQIKNQPYYIEVYLYNQLNGYNPMPIPYLFIDSLSIEESLLTWVVKGSITIRNDYEIMERGALSNQHNAAVPPSYVFRTDGRNKISFRISPVVTSNSTSVFEQKYWEMSFDCVIYDVEDLETNSSSRKLRRFYFWDERYQILSERNIEYASALSNSSQNTFLALINSSRVAPEQVFSTTPDLASATLTDKQKAANPNQIVMDIITTAASNPPVMKNNTGGLTGAGGASIINVGFLEEGSIDNPTQPMGGSGAIDTENWDVGNNKNLLIYNSTSNSKAIDDLNYVLDHCVSSNKNCPVFLRLGRTSKDKKWKLISLASIFQKSFENQVEHLYIEDAIIGNAGPYVPRAPTDTPDNNTNFSSPFASRIQSYRFSPMVASDDDRITNYPVHNYDFSTNTYNITFSDNTAQSVRDKMKAIGSNALWNLSKGVNGGSVLLNLNRTKKEGIHLKNKLLTKKIFQGAPTNFTGNMMLKDALFLNEAITFVVHGLTIRTPGKFIFIDRFSSAGDKNPFDDRFLGQWLIIKVNHVFTQDDYVTEIVAVKVDSNSTLWTQTETKY